MVLNYVLAVYRVRRVTHLMRNRGIDQVKQLLVCISHVAHDLARNINDLHHIFFPAQSLLLNLKIFFSLRIPLMNTKDLALQIVMVHFEKVS